MSDKSTSCKRETFVYGEKEVVKTGRTATRKKKSLRSSNVVVKTLIEICPVSMMDKTNNMYNSWVDETELFMIGED